MSAAQAERICSLLPSATEIVCSLGLRDRLVAITHECDFPPQVAGLPRITSSAIDHETSDSHRIHRHISRAVHEGSSIYHLDQHLLEQLDPDLILTQELCDVCAVSYSIVAGAVRTLEGPARVLSLEPTSVGEIIGTIRTVGREAGVPERAENLAAGLQERIEAVRSKAAPLDSRPRVFAMEWLDPPFVGGHWVPEMIDLAGGVDVVGKAGGPSRELPWDEIEAAKPEVVVLMPCGFDLQRTLDETARTPCPSPWKRLEAVRSGRVYAVDGSGYFNRPGPRIVDGLEILAEILHPEVFERRMPASSWQAV